MSEKYRIGLVATLLITCCLMAVGVTAEEKRKPLSSESIIKITTSLMFDAGAVE